MTDIREAFKQTGPTVDLGNKEWEVMPGDELNFKRNVTGDGYTIRLLPLPTRIRAWRPFKLRGIDQYWDGHGRIIGSMPDNAPYDKKREAQHAIQFNGAKGIEVSGIDFSNIWGDPLYCDKSEEDGSWCEDVNIHDCTFDQIGRHVLTPNAVNHIQFADNVIGRVNRAIVDIEPDTASWGCTYFDWLNTLITGPGMGNFVLANKGTSPRVHHIHVDGVHCTQRPWSMTVNPITPTGKPQVVRHHFIIANVSGTGDSSVSRPQFSFRHTDDVNLYNIRQPIAGGGPLVFVEDCNRIYLGGKRIAGT